MLYSKSIRQNSGLIEALLKNNGGGDPIGNLFSELASVATFHYTSCGTQRQTATEAMPLHCGIYVLRCMLQGYMC